MKIVHVFAVMMAMLALAACGGKGGGSGSSSGGSGGSSGSGNTILSGVVSKGPFYSYSSSVKVYSLANGARTLLKSTWVINDTGRYQADLGTYSGPVLVEASGYYYDEASGSRKLIPAQSPLRAALASAGGNTPLSVTGITEMAVRYAGSSLTPAAIANANDLVSQFFKIQGVVTVNGVAAQQSITATEPVDPRSPGALNGAAQPQVDYTMALAALSQLAAAQPGATDSEKMTNALAYIAQGMSPSGLSLAVATDIKSSLATFLAGGNNMTGLTSNATTSLRNMGTPSRNYRLTLNGPIAAGAVAGLQFSLYLPGRADIGFNSLTSTVFSNNLYLSGSAPSGGTLLGSYTPSAGSVSSMAIIYAASIATVNGKPVLQGLGSGEFATIVCNYPVGSSPPPVSDFIIYGTKISDADGKPITGATISIN